MVLLPKRPSPIGLRNKSCVKSTCSETRAKDSIIKSGQKDTYNLVSRIFFVDRQPWVRGWDTEVSVCNSNWQQFGKKTKEMTAVIQHILTSAQSLGSQDYYNKVLMTILRIAGVLFCENEQTYTESIIVCSGENTYLSAWGSHGRCQSNSR